MRSGKPESRRMRRKSEVGIRSGAGVEEEVERLGKRKFGVPDWEISNSRFVGGRRRETSGHPVPNADHSNPYFRAIGNLATPDMSFKTSTLENPQSSSIFATSSA